MKIALLRHGMTAGNKKKQYIGSTDDPLSEEGIALAESLRGEHTCDNAAVSFASQSSASSTAGPSSASSTAGPSSAGSPFVCPSSVFVTPLLRTRQTAAILFPGAKQIVVGGLREMDFGIFEGRTAGEMVGDADYRAWVDGGCTGVCPGGEGMEGFRDRVCAAFSEVLHQAVEGKSETCRNLGEVNRSPREANSYLGEANSNLGEAKRNPANFAGDDSGLTFVVHGGVIMAILSTFANENKQYYDYFVHNCCGYLCDCNIENAGGSADSCITENIEGSADNCIPENIEGSADNCIAENSGGFADSYLVENGGEKKRIKAILLTNLTPIKGSQWNWDTLPQHDSGRDAANSAIRDFLR